MNRGRVASLLLAAALLGSAQVLTAQETYQVDRSHSSVAFVVRHLMVSNVRGQFNDFNGSIVLDEQDLTKSSVQVVINTGSIDTNHERRDGDLRGPNFFDVARFPQATFVSKRIERTGNGLVAVGDLTIRDVTREVRIPFELTGPINAGNGRKRIGVEGSLKIVRQDYGLNWNNVVESVPVVADEVRIELAVEAVSAAARQ